MRLFYFFSLIDSKNGKIATTKSADGGDRLACYCSSERGKFFKLFAKVLNYMIKANAS